MLRQWENSRLHVVMHLFGAWLLEDKVPDDKPPSLKHKGTLGKATLTRG